MYKAVCLRDGVSVEREFASEKDADEFVATGLTDGEYTYAYVYNDGVPLKTQSLGLNGRWRCVEWEFEGGCAHWTTYDKAYENGPTKENVKKGSYEGMIVDDVYRAWASDRKLVEAGDLRPPRRRKSAG